MMVWEGRPWQSFEREPLQEIGRPGNGSIGENKRPGGLEDVWKEGGIRLDGFG